MIKHRDSWRSLGLAFALFAATHAALAEDNQPASAAPEPAAGAQTTTNANDYHIGSLDLLEIKVLHVDEISRSVRVDANGNISLPLVGVIRAAGLTSYQLEQSIAAKLAVDLIQNPQVSVFIKEFTSQRITVQGLVKKAGVYDFSGTPTLLQAISMGGGLDEKGDELNVKVVRRGPNQTAHTMTYDLTAIRQNNASDPVLKGGDVVIVEEAHPITVEGSVSKPGSFYPRGRATLMQMISQSGGLTDLADPSSVRVFSNAAGGQKTSTVYDIESIREGKQADPEVRQGDLIVVEKSTGKAMIQGITSTLRGFIGFGTVGR